ncbi:MAG TPA: PEGA domain-containing protein [Myxococcales bacterium]
MRFVLCVLLLGSPALFAQEEPSPSGGEEGAIPPSAHPGSDSPEAVRAAKYDGPRRRAQAFLIPMDEKARAPTTRVAQAIETVLAHTPMYEVIDLGRALSVESTAEQGKSADEGRKLIADGNLVAVGKRWPEAAGMYEKAVRAFDKGLPAVGPLEYADALLRLGAAEWMSGDEKAARQAMQSVARLDPQQKLDARRIEPGVVSVLQAARAEAAAARMGVLDVDSLPAGGRVSVDGEDKGSAPIHTELPGGRHLLRIERSRYYPHAELVEIAPRKTLQRSVTLVATPTATILNQIIAGAADEVGHGNAGKSVTALAEKFSLERVLIGSVRSQEEKVTVLLALVDAPNHRLVASKSLLLIADGTDADQIEIDTQNAVRKLVSQDSSPAQDAAPAQAASERKAVMPGTAPGADDPGLVTKERKAVATPAKAEPETAAPASSEAVKDDKKKQDSKKKKKKGIQGKSGTEDWPED